VRALDGESYVSVNVEPPRLWHPGRVVLAAPAGWEWLLEAAAGEALAHTPTAWELVVKPATPIDLAAERSSVMKAAAGSSRSSSPRAPSSTPTRRRWCRPPRSSGLPSSASRAAIVVVDVWAPGQESCWRPTATF